MQLIYNLLNSDDCDDVVYSQVCAIVGEWKYYDEYKKDNQLKFLD